MCFGSLMYSTDPGLNMNWLGNFLMALSGDSIRVLIWDPCGWLPLQRLSYEKRDSSNLRLLTESICSDQPDQRIFWWEVNRKGMIYKVSVICPHDLIPVYRTYTSGTLWPRGEGGGRGRCKWSVVWGLETQLRKAEMYQERVIFLEGATMKGRKVELVVVLTGLTKVKWATKEVIPTPVFLKEGHSL